MSNIQVYNSSIASLSCHSIYLAFYVIMSPTADMVFEFDMSLNTVIIHNVPFGQ